MSFDFSMLYPSCSVVNSKFSESLNENKLLRKTYKLAGTIILKQRDCIERYLSLKLDASVTVTLQIASFWIMSSCSAIDGYLHFGVTCCLHLQGGSEDGSHQSRMKLWQPPMRLDCASPKGHAFNTGIAIRLCGAYVLSRITGVTLTCAYMLLFETRGKIVSRHLSTVKAKYSHLFCYRN
jgi:hypothetical protein